MKNPFINRPITRQPVHIIYRLQGSLPTAVIRQLTHDYQSAIDHLSLEFELTEKRSTEQQLAYTTAVRRIKQRYQNKYDQLLDRQKNGPMWLASQKAKQIVIDSWLHLEKVNSIEVDAISVMSNHVHILLSHAAEYESLDFIPLMARHKHFTATKINKLLGRVGLRFWAKKAFDRDVRRRSYGTVLWYILNNPVKAELTDDPLHWGGNYLAKRLH